VPLEVKVSRQAATARAVAACAQWIRNNEVAVGAEALVEVGYGLEKDRDRQQLRSRLHIDVAEPEARPIALVTVDAASGRVLDV
jgi:hypothetical protein